MVDRTICSNCWEDITRLPLYLQKRRICRDCYNSQVSHRDKKLKAIYVPVQIADRVMNKAVAIAHAMNLAWKANVDVIDEEEF